MMKVGGDLVSCVVKIERAQLGLSRDPTHQAAVKVGQT